jgi:chromosome segregation ATPase
MTISGPEVHQQLMTAYADLQAKIESGRGQLSKVDQTRAELDDDRSEALARLAEHYLPELTIESVRETWREVRPSIAQILTRQQAHASRVTAHLNDLTSQRQQCEQILLKLNADLDQATESQQQVAEQVEQHLQSDAEFADLSDRAAVAEAALERAEANFKEIDDDARHKLPAYQESALFQYLRDRQYGTAHYRHRGFTRRMDRALAQYIGYHKAKQNYDFLVNTPQQMQQIIDSDRQALQVVMAELEKQRDRIAEKFGLPTKIAAVEKLETQRSEQLTTIDQLLQQTETVQNELSALRNPRGQYYQDAIRAFREMLAKSDPRDLRRRAQTTDELIDDQIVAGLMGVETEITNLQHADQDQRQKLGTAQETLNHLGRLIQRFRAAKFDSARSQFVESLDILGDLDRAIDTGDLDWMWDQIRRSQRWGPTAMDQVTAVATHPMTQILINAMAHAVGGALQQHARRAGRRSGRGGPEWGGSWSGTWGGDSSGWYRRR